MFFQIVFEDIKIVSPLVCVRVFFQKVEPMQNKAI